MRQYGGLAAFGTLGATFRPLFAQAQTRVSDGSASIPLPNRGEFVIRNGFILTMDPALGDIPRGSVHVRNGEIVAVGADVTAPGVEVIDATDMIVLPGLTETHWHMWNTLFRSFAGDEQAHGYFPTVARFGAVMTPDDMYQGARLSAAEAINTGMTTVHDWCHNIRSREHAERDIQALKDAGIRTRFSYGWSQGQDDKDIINLRDLEALHREWHKHAAEGLITLGLGWRGKFRAGPLPENVFTHRIRSHAGNGNSADGPHPEQEPARQIEAHAKENLLGKDVQLVHAVWAAPPHAGTSCRDGGPAGTRGRCLRERANAVVTRVIKWLMPSGAWSRLCRRRGSTIRNRYNRAGDETISSSHAKIEKSILAKFLPQENTPGVASDEQVPPECN